MFNNYIYKEITQATDNCQNWIKTPQSNTHKQYFTQSGLY